MPRIKPATVTLRDGTILRENKDKIEYGSQLISTYAVEMQAVEKRIKWGRKVREMAQVRVPILSWPYTQITRIDWGYVDQATFNRIKSELDKAKQAEQSKKSERANAGGEKVGE